MAPALAACGMRVAEDGMASRLPRQVVIAAAIWVALAVGGLAELAVYSAAAGTPASAPRRFPSDSTIAPDPNEPTLVMLAHPHCPCSRASIAELARLLASAERPIRTYVLFLHPDGVDEDWVESDLWRSAAAIPGVTVVSDTNGAEAARFGAVTSGQTLLYDADGTLVFNGGITPARGHEGDSAGRAAILAVVANPSVARDVETPVFGCELARAAKGCTDGRCPL